MKMKCEQYKELFTGWINETLNKTEQEQLDRHLATCPACHQELAAMQQLWDDMAIVETPEPSPLMRVRFEAMLDTYKAEEAEKGGTWIRLKQQLKHLWQYQPRWPMAYNLAIILVTFGCGYLFFEKSRSGDEQEQMKMLSAQVHELKQTMMLTMLENPSASERMRAVSYTSEMKNTDSQVINALLATLNNDPNVNVRLSTLDALTRLAGHPEVRQGLIRSIAGQESPLMQSAIADVMLKLQERKSVKPLRKLLKQKNLDEGVREKITETINSLI